MKNGGKAEGRRLWYPVICTIADPRDKDEILQCRQAGKTGKLIAIILPGLNPFAVSDPHGYICGPWPTARAADRLPHGRY